MKKIILIALLIYTVQVNAQTNICNDLSFATGTINNWAGAWAGSAHSFSAQQYAMIETPCANNLISGLNSGGQNNLAYVHEICTAGTDPHVPISRVAPGHAYSLRLGNDVAWKNGTGAASTPGYNHQTIKYTIPVTAQTPAINYWFAAVFSQEQSTPHAPADQPYLSIKIFDQSCNQMACATYQANATAAAIGGYNQLDSLNYDAFGDSETFIYKNWTMVSIPLTAYIGQNVTIQFETSDCDAGGHFGYAYIAVDCSSLNITSNPTCFAAGTNTLTAPGGYATYQWSGTGITGSTSTQTTTVNAAGSYSVTLTNAGGCTLTIDTVIAQAATINVTASPQTICTGFSSTLTAGGAQTYTWSTGENTATIIPTPTTTTIYTVTGTDTHNCTITDTISVTVNNCTTKINRLTENNNTITIYPNPAQNNFTIETSSAEKQTLSIFDVNGKQVLSQNINGTTTIDVNNLVAGVYYARITNNATTTTKQLVIVK